MEESRHVAIVGRPNVGKSRLFNRLVGKRVAIVHDQPGVTRDLSTHEVDDDFTLMDTGGIGMTSTEMSPKEINEATEEQVDFAIQAASLVLFVVDGLEGLTPLDQEIAQSLRTYNKNVLLVVNKIDLPRLKDNTHQFYKLGFKELISVSAEHDLNTKELKELVLKHLGPKPETPAEDDLPSKKRIKICFSGRPNVGKSSIGNALLKADRLIVSNVPGTTRDSVQTNLDYQAPDETTWEFQLTDTAGLKPKVKVKTSVDYFSGLRTRESINDADVVFLVVDAFTGITKQDKRLAGDILKEGKGLVIVVNKWDKVRDLYHDSLKDSDEYGIQGYDSEDEYRMAYVKAVRKELFFLPNSPIVFTSATENLAIEELLRRAKALFERQSRNLKTSRVNKTIQTFFARKKPSIVSGKRFKVYYALQVSHSPIKIRIFCNQKERLEDSYLRYVENGFRDEFQLRGCPIFFEFVGKPKRYAKK